MRGAILIAAVTALAAGCPAGNGNETPLDGGIDGGGGCLYETDCPSGDYCFAGECLPVSGGDCDYDFDCNPGYWCLAGDCAAIESAGAPLCRTCSGFTGECGDPDNLCLAHGSSGALFCGTDCSTLACPAGFQCVTIQSGGTVYGRQCVPRNGSLCPEDAGPASCTIDGQCDPDYECVAGYCTLQQGAPCTFDLDCEPGEICEGGFCGGTGPPPGCTLDAECQPGYRCAGGTCVVDDRPECTVDGDCPAGEVCQGGACVADDGTCAVDADCGPGYVCEGGACADCGLGGATWQGFALTFMNQYCTECHEGYASYDSVLASTATILSSTVDPPWTMPTGQPAPAIEERDLLGRWLRCGAPR